MRSVFIIGLALEWGLLYAGDVKRTRPAAVVIRPLAGGGGGAALGPISAAPGTISFTATDPDLLTVAGSSASTISWSIVSGGSNSQTWTLQVQAASTTFTGCSTVPVSAVRVTCSSVVVSGGGGSGACSAPFNLSTSLQQVAGGAEANNTTVTISFTLADSWRYIATTSQTCTQTLTYTVTAP